MIVVNPDTFFAAMVQSAVEQFDELEKVFATSGLLLPANARGMILGSMVTLACAETIVALQKGMNAKVDGRDYSKVCELTMVDLNEWLLKNKFGRNINAEDFKLFGPKITERPKPS